MGFHGGRFENLLAPRIHLKGLTLLYSNSSQHAHHGKILFLNDFFLDDAVQLVEVARVEMGYAINILVVKINELGGRRVASLRQRIHLDLFHEGFRLFQVLVGAAGPCNSSPINTVLYFGE